MDKKEFEKLVVEALKDLPEWFREKLENIEIVIEDEPSKRTLKEMGLGRDDTLLGLYHGVPLDERGFYYGNVLPDKISLYMKPILEEAYDYEDIAEVVRETVMHEIGHYFGLTDEELEELEEG